MIRNLVPLCSIISDSTRCELLSKVDIFDIRNNRPSRAAPLHAVVNCSQKLISLIFGTTFLLHLTLLFLLWIALKSWYLWYSEQLNKQYLASSTGCELLSKVDIFDIRNNRIATHPHSTCVVNCSQKLISLIFGTTITPLTESSRRLWIALKSWYLWYSEQPK